MSKFIVAIFPDVPSAEVGIRALKDPASEDAIILDGAAVVTKEDSGKLTMHVMADDGPAVAAAGAVIGGLVWR